MVTRRSDYNQIQVEAAHTVLLELIRVLGAYKAHLVIIGGWVPALLLKESKELHIGSLDVDIALDHRAIADENYRNIKELLLQRGYIEGKQPFIFHRKVKIAGLTIDVEVDFLAGEYCGTGTMHRTQPVQDIKARKARGCELAFENNIETKIEGILPEGGIDSATVRVAAIVPFIVMKAMALYDRLKEKDAWDIYYCVKNYQGGIDALVSEFKQCVGNSLVKEGLRKIAEKFATADHIGPTLVADFEEIVDQDERGRIKRDAFERINYLLKELGVLRNKSST